jgi:hypothetical protein
VNFSEPIRLAVTEEMKIARSPKEKARGSDGVMRESSPFRGRDRSESLKANVDEDRRGNAVRHEFR